MCPDIGKITEVEKLRAIWENLANNDPLWAIVSAPGKKGGRWDLEEFLKTGLDEIDQLFETLRVNDIEFDLTSALDFGCGVGRLTQALARRSELVCGVDISSIMIERANQLNRYKGKCTYLVNARDDLQLFENERFSFLYSNMVLQHMAPSLAKHYLAEFGRILRSNGLLIFQLPSRLKNEDGLPSSAWASSIECLEQEYSWAASSTVTIAVRVQNESSMPWQYELPTAIMLGNHWRDKGGHMIRQDDGRAVVPNSLRPGEKVDLRLEISAPPSPGHYILELDLVQEGVAWFADKGAETLRLPVKVVHCATDVPVLNSDTRRTLTDVASGIGASITEAFKGFSMHCIPRSEVVRLLYQHNMQVEFLESSHCGGPGYQSYMYFARKSVDS